MEFSKASNGLSLILSFTNMSNPISAIFRAPFEDESAGLTLSLKTFAGNLLPHTSSPEYEGIDTFRNLFSFHSS